MNITKPSPSSRFSDRLNFDNLARPAKPMRVMATASGLELRIGDKPAALPAVTLNGGQALELAAFITEWWGGDAR